MTVRIIKKQVESNKDETPQDLIDHHKLKAVVFTFKDNGKTLEYFEKETSCVSNILQYHSDSFEEIRPKSKSIRKEASYMGLMKYSSTKMIIVIMILTVV